MERLARISPLRFLVAFNVVGALIIVYIFYVLM